MIFLYDINILSWNLSANIIDDILLENKLKYPIDW